jgi:hypothetical protein
VTIGRNSFAKPFFGSRVEVPCPQELGSLEPSLAALAVALPLPDGDAVKNTATLARERWDGRTAAAVVLQGLSLRQLRWAALTWEFFAALLLFASGNVPPVLLRSLQLFLRF